MWEFNFSRRIKVCTVALCSKTLDQGLISGISRKVHRHFRQFLDGARLDTSVQVSLYELRQFCTTRKTLCRGGIVLEDLHRFSRQLVNVV